MPSKAIFGMGRRINETASRPAAEELEVITDWIENGPFLTAEQGLEIGRSVADGLAKGIGVVEDGE